MQSNNQQQQKERQPKQKQQQQQKQKQQKSAQVVEEVKGPQRDFSSLKLFDVAANLSDDRYKGIYNGHQVHEPDFDIVIKRAHYYGVRKFLLAGGYIHDALDSYNLSLKSEDFYCTIGVHPCRAKEPFIEYDKTKGDSEKERNEDEIIADYFAKIDEILSTSERKDKYIAIGECGLDYDRFEYADKETQLKIFPPHFDLAQKYNMPMYLHSRSTQGDFPRIVKENRHKFSTGVVHSFTGDADELKELLSMGLYIGVNGCSLKTQENCELVKLIPLDRMVLETDSPYCDIRNSHASSKLVKTSFQKVTKEKYKADKMNKDRNEPCTMIQVLEVVSALTGRSEEEIAEIAWENSLKIFNLKE